MDLPSGVAMSRPAHRLVPVLPLLFAAQALAAAPKPRTFTLTSPGRKVQVTVQTGEALRYQVQFLGQAILAPSPVSMTLEGGTVLGHGTFKTSTERTVDQVLKPVVRVKRAEIRDHFTELRLEFKEHHAVTFRAYDDGVAYRFTTSFPGDVKVLSEEAAFNFPADHKLWFPEEKSFHSHQERAYVDLTLDAVGKRFCSIPALVDAGGPKVAITESDLFGYPGMDLTAGTAPHSLQGLFPAYPRTLKVKGDRDEFVVDTEPFLARTRGARDFPWRVLALAAEDKDLLSNDLVYRLAREADPADTAWIKPGKASWDWWNDNNVYGVDFRAGVNNPTYKHYIDFAAANGLEYIILDEGWYKLGDLTAQVPGIDVPELVAYGKAKGVGVILWASWKTLDDQFEKALDLFASWGVKGIKVDFMQRQDQPMVEFYERTARAALKRHFLVSFHGAYKPTGLGRTFPNVLSHEGVRGLEQNKWGKEGNSRNAVTFPFIRMLAGPVDYTPGAMLNAQPKDHRDIYTRPMSLGTRCAQLAMYVAYECPLQMLADSPSNYAREPECMEFLAKVPSVWDETLPLGAKVGEWLMTARRSGQDFYVGAMTNEEARDLTLDTSFLPEGAWEARIWQDGINADRVGIDYRKRTVAVRPGQKLDLHLAPGGGWAARFVRTGLSQH
jgi:alpha-glucosidase